jgi:hypothetical protein
MPTLVENITKHSSKIAGVMGINKAGDLQFIFMPKIIPGAFSENGTAIIDNSTNSHSAPSFVFTDSSDLGLIAVIENFPDIPDEIRPEEHLSSKFLKDTSWAKAKGPLGLALFPVIVPIFFGQKHIEVSIHDADFENKLESFSPKHLQLAKLMKEHIQQQENDGKDIDTIIIRLFGRVRSKSSNENSKFATAGFIEAQIPDSSFFPVYNLPKDKWKEYQNELREFFVENPSPVRQPRPVQIPSATSPVTTSAAPTAPPAAPFAPPIVNVSTSQPNHPQPFDAVAFMQQINSMLASQQPQTIVVESRADKCRESEAKFNNNMLQLLLIGGESVISHPASFVNPRILTYTQAMKNILAMPTSIRAIQAVNILSTVFAEIPSDMAERLSPLTTHKSLYHISKNFASALLSCNFQRTSLTSLNFETSSITILSFVEQNDIARVEAHCEAEQIAKNEREFDFIKTHHKVLKTTIEG